MTLISRIPGSDADLHTVHRRLRPPVPSVTATISGVVRDPSGAVIPGAQVIARNHETGAAVTVLTDAQGFYSLQGLPVDTYDVEINKGGIQTIHPVRPGALCQRCSETRRGSRTWERRGKGHRLSGRAACGNHQQPDGRGHQRGNHDRRAPGIAQLHRPAGSAARALPQALPAWRAAQGGNFSATGFTLTPISGSLNAGNQSVNGQREASNGFLLNGTTVQEFAFSGTGIIPNLDSIEEFRILTNNFDAEYGNYAGGQINVITKSGTNRFHGSVFEFLRNTDFDAKNYFATTRDDHKENQFGGTIGGPIKHDKLFFFGDYQGDRIIIGQSALGRIPVPSDAERAGDFSDPSLGLAGSVKGPYWAQQLSSNLGYTVTQGEPYYFAGCNSSELRLSRRAKIPASVITVPSKNLLAYVPPANTTDGGNTYFTPKQSSAAPDGR